MQSLLIKLTELTKEQQKIMEKEDIKICHLGDSDYPPLLREIHNPPEVLYYRGALAEPDDFTFAVVGTRKHSHYAERAVDLILPDLISAGAVIVSGLALGIDTLAHEAAVKAKTKTIAVLGGGVDTATLYPYNNHSLAEKIIELGGAVISEYPPLSKPTKWTFPARNRIIAGLSRGVLVIEAPKHSGALITAYQALDEGRDVYVIPGDITRPESEGCNELIKRGAKPVLRASDILEEYGITPQEIKKNLPPLDKTEELIVSMLGNEPVNIDELVQETKMSIGTLSGLLAVLEMKGAVKNVGGMRFVKI